MYRLALICAIACAACDDGPATVGDPLDDPQTPPRGSDDLITWIEAGHYQAWACEPAPHPPRSPSAHSANRICSNELLASATGTGAFPVGAATVKEIFNSSGAIALYAVARRVDDGPDGNSWYWFEGKRGDAHYNGEGEDLCVGCHARAPRDFLFTVVTN
ncbi:MAG TPA: hypothetical protein VIV11_26945 [Kofleriaceae bacterium]